jgi:hypothetical protein
LLLFGSVVIHHSAAKLRGQFEELFISYLVVKSKEFISFIFLGKFIFHFASCHPKGFFHTNTSGYQLTHLFESD